MSARRHLEVGESTTRGQPVDFSPYKNIQMKNNQKGTISVKKGVDNSILWGQNPKALVAISRPDPVKWSDGGSTAHIRNHPRRAEEAGHHGPKTAYPGRAYCHYPPGRATLGHSAAPTNGDHPILRRRLGNSLTKHFIAVRGSHGRSAARGHRGRSPPTAASRLEYSWVRHPEKHANHYRAATKLGFGMPSIMFSLTSTLLIRTSSRAPPLAASWSNVILMQFTRHRGDFVYSRDGITSPGQRTVLGSVLGLNGA